MTVYYAEGAKGLLHRSRGLQHTEVFTLVGAHNVADVDLQEGYGMSPVSLEQVIAWDPEFVFVASDPDGEMNVYDQITTGGDWATVSAVKTARSTRSRTARSTGSTGPIPSRRILGIQWVGNLLYPELWDYRHQGDDQGVLPALLPLSS